jgi:hypothetical protein
MPSPPIIRKPFGPYFRHQITKRLILMGFRELVRFHKMLGGSACAAPNSLRTGK